MKSHREKYSVLLVDDEPSSLELYSELMTARLNTLPTTARYPTQALALARERLFDVVIIDVTMSYQGSQFGGLDLYKQLLPRYGSSSLLAYSQYITDDLLKHYNYNFNFIEKPTSAVRFVDQLNRQIETLLQQQTCFVAMPFDPEYDLIFETIEHCVHQASYTCTRVDRQQFTTSIIDKILAEIINSKVVIFVASGENPNAFFECGYAVALDKEVVTITDHHNKLPFNIRDRNAIAFADDLPRLREELSHRLLKLT